MPTVIDLFEEDKSEFPLKHLRAPTLELKEEID